MPVEGCVVGLVLSRHASFHTGFVSHRLVALQRSGDNSLDVMLREIEVELRSALPGFRNDVRWALGSATTLGRTSNRLNDASGVRVSMS